MAPPTPEQMREMRASTRSKSVDLLAAGRGSRDEVWLTNRGATPRTPRWRGLSAQHLEPRHRVWKPCWWGWPIGTHERQPVRRADAAVRARRSSRRVPRSGLLGVRLFVIGLHQRADGVSARLLRPLEHGANGRGHRARRRLPVSSRRAGLGRFSDDAQHRCARFIRHRCGRAPLPTPQSDLPISLGPG